MAVSTGAGRGRSDSLRKHACAVRSYRTVVLQGPWGPGRRDREVSGARKSEGAGDPRADEGEATELSGIMLADS